MKFKDLLSEDNVNRGYSNAILDCLGKTSKMSMVKVAEKVFKKEWDEITTEELDGFKQSFGELISSNKVEGPGQALGLDDSSQGNTAALYKLSPYGNPDGYKTV